MWRKKLSSDNFWIWGNDLDPSQRQNYFHFYFYKFVLVNPIGQLDFYNPIKFHDSLLKSHKHKHKSKSTIYPPYSLSQIIDRPRKYISWPLIELVTMWPTSIIGLGVLHYHGCLRFIARAGLQAWVLCKSPVSTTPHSPHKQASKGVICDLLRVFSDWW